jgi:hypothetical protein
VVEFARMSEQQYAGDVHRVVRYGGMTTNPMDLRMFPFDHDDIEVTFLGNACSTLGQVQRSLFHTQRALTHTLSGTRLTLVLCTHHHPPPPTPLPGRCHERQLQNRLPPALPGTVQCAVQYSV